MSRADNVHAPHQAHIRCTLQAADFLFFSSQGPFAIRNSGVSKLYTWLFIHLALSLFSTGSRFYNSLSLLAQSKFLSFPFLSFLASVLSTESPHFQLQIMNPPTCRDISL